MARTYKRDSNGRFAGGGGGNGRGSAGKGSSASQGGSNRGRADTTRAIGMMRGGASRRPVAGMLRAMNANDKRLARRLNQQAIASRRAGGGRSNPGRQASIRSGMKQIARAATSQRRIAARRPGKA